MEHYPNRQPMKRRARFSFEAFDQLCADALDDSEAVLEAEPAQLGDVVDLNANVTDLFPPDDAA